MKKLIALIITMLISFSVLSACGQEKVEPNPSNQPGAKDGPDLSPVPNQKKGSLNIVLYFSDNDLTATYRINKEIEVKEGHQIEKQAIQAWIEGPEHQDLKGLINPGTIVEYVEDVNGVAHVSFSNEITRSNLGSAGELMLAEQVAMIMEQFGYGETQILVEGEVRETLLGSLYVGEPIYAGNPDDYLWVDDMEDGFVLQNVAFRIYEPAPNSKVQENVVIRGLARVYEGTIQYEFEDGHYILEQGFTTASEGAPGWGEFEIVIEAKPVSSDSGTVILYEESAKDGSRVHELYIPITFESKKGN